MVYTLFSLPGSGAAAGDQGRMRECQPPLGRNELLTELRVVPVSLPDRLGWLADQDLADRCKTRSRSTPPLLPVGLVLPVPGQQPFGARA